VLRQHKLTFCVFNDGPSESEVGVLLPNIPDGQLLLWLVRTRTIPRGTGSASPGRAFTRRHRDQNSGDAWRVARSTAQQTPAPFDAAGIDRWVSLTENKEIMQLF
jgi:hypothetical protein